MKPVLVAVFGVAVPSYPVLMALGFVAALLVVLVMTPPDDRRQAVDLFVVMVVTALFGAKFGHVLFEAPGHVGRDGQPITSVFELLADDPWHPFALNEPGYVWYGGLIACLGVAVVYFRRRPQLDGWRFADAFAPAVLVGAALGRLGCFLAGCCHGAPTDGPLGIRFPHLPGPVHATQLYDAGAAAILAGLLVWRAPNRRFEGELVAWMLMGYASLRFMTETVRGDAERGALAGLSTSQWLSVPVFAAGFFVWVRRRRLDDRRRQEGLER